jgi:hypothetical protein
MWWMRGRRLQLPRMHSFSNQINLPTVDDASLINMNNEAVYLLTISAANFKNHRRDRHLRKLPRRQGRRRCRAM